MSIISGSLVNQIAQSDRHRRRRKIPVAHPRKVPTVGAHQTGQVRLSPQLRHMLIRQSQKIAKRRYAPEIQALKAQRAPIRKTYHREVASAKGAIGFAEQQLGHAEANLKSSGLKGRYLKQTTRELAARSGDVAQSLPFMTAEAKQTKQTDMAALQQKIVDARVSQSQKFADTLASLEQSAQLHGRSFLDSKRSSAKSSKNKHAGLKDVKQAVRAAHILIATTDPAKLPWAQKTVDHFGSQQAAWQAFVRELMAQEGVSDWKIANAAVSIIKRQLHPLPTGGRGPTLQGF